MGKMRKVLGMLVCGSILFGMTGCDAIQKTPEAKQKSVVATVGDEKITLLDVDKQLASYIEQIKSQYKVDDISKSKEASEVLVNYRKSILDSLITQSVYLKKAEELKLVPSDEELNKEVEAKLKNLKELYGDDSKYQEALKNENLTEDELKEELKKSVIVEKVQDHILKDVKVTDEDIKKYYEDNKKTAYTKKSGADMYHILVADEATAKKIKSELDGGAKFSDLAKKYGTDGTKDNGGSLGYVEYEADNMDKDFLAGAKKLKEGEISNPVKTQFGYHIIMVKNVQADGYVEPFDSVKEGIKSNLSQQKNNDAITKANEDWRKDIKIEKKEDNLNLFY